MKDSPVMKPDGSGERMIAEGFHNEGPTFSPNGLLGRAWSQTPVVAHGPDFGRFNNKTQRHRNSGGSAAR